MKTMLTAAMIERLTPPAAGRLEVFDKVLPWLAVRVTPAGHRSYVVRARVKGHTQPITYTLGDARLLSLADAREKARETLLAMRRGIDPREQKKAEAATAARQQRTTFAAVAEAFVADHVSKLRTSTRTAADLRRYLIAAWGSRPIASISADDLAEVIQAIVDQGKPAQANRVLTTAKALFRWAAAPARSRDERLAVNPALNLTSRDFNIKPTPRQVALTADHLRLIWTCAAGLGEPWTAFFRFLLLSGQRRGEVAGMRWEELDLDPEHVWLIPAARMKMKRPHEVPLSPAMIELLAGVPRTDGPFVFAAPGGGLPISAFDRIKRRLDVLIGEQQPGLPSWTIHDLRRAVRTGLGALPSVPHDVRELVIAHVPPALVQT